MSTRERKYRAWDPEDQCFAYFTLADVDERGCIKVPHGTMRLSFIDPELITEYIGRQDADGRDIYEGDKVVQVGHESFVYTLMWTNENYGQVWTWQPMAMSDGYWCPYEYYYGGWDSSEFRVVGNIFEQ